MNAKKFRLIRIKCARFLKSLADLGGKRKECRKSILLVIIEIINSVDFRDDYVCQIN